MATGRSVRTNGAVNGNGARLDVVNDNQFNEYIENQNKINQMIMERLEEMAEAQQAVAESQRATAELHNQAAEIQSVTAEVMAQLVETSAERQTPVSTTSTSSNTFRQTATRVRQEQVVEQVVEQTPIVSAADVTGLTKIVRDEMNTAQHAVRQMSGDSLDRLARTYAEHILSGKRFRLRDLPFEFPIGISRHSVSAWFGAFRRYFTIEFGYAPIAFRANSIQ